MKNVSTRQQQNQENDTTRGQSAVRTDSSQITGGPDMSVAASSQGTSGSTRKNYALSLFLVIIIVIKQLDFVSLFHPFFILFQ